MSIRLLFLLLLSSSWAYSDARSLVISHVSGKAILVMVSLYFFFFLFFFDIPFVVTKWNSSGQPQIDGIRLI